MADEIIETASTTPTTLVRGQKTDFDHIQRYRLRVEARKWLLSKMLPKVYGDRITQEHTGNVGFEVYGEPEKASAEEWISVYASLDS